MTGQLWCKGEPKVRRVPARGLRVIKSWLPALACAGLCCVANSSAATPHTESVQAEPASEQEVFLVGSSSINHAFGRIIARELSERGYQVTSRGVASAGLARPDFRDMHELVEALPISSKTAAVFLYLGVNDGQALWLRPTERRSKSRHFMPWSSPRWRGVYTRRARALFDGICERGARRVVVLLPVDVNLPRLQRRLQRIRKLQIRAASYSSCAVAVSTAGDAGHFEVDGIARRMADGFHMSHEGAQIVWDRVRIQALGLIGARPWGDEVPKLWCSAPHDRYPFCQSPQGRR